MTGAEGVSGGGRRRGDGKGCRESDPDGDPHIHPIVYLLRKHTRLYGESIQEMENGWMGERGSECKQD